MRKYPDAGIVITGDFNSSDTDSLSRTLKLVQVLKKPTRGSNILDKIFFNCNQLYSEPSILCPVGKSDHNCVLLKPGVYTHNSAIKKSVVNRRLTEDAVSRIVYELGQVRWHDMYSMND